MLFNWIRNKCLRSLTSFSGYRKHRSNSGIVESIIDKDLKLLNKMLPWTCFTVDLHGRRFGNIAWNGKRDKAQKIPDSRIVQMDKRFSLHGKSILEVGCYEGVHTIGLAQYSNDIYAIDSRIENVIKTIVRTNLFGFNPKVSVCNLDNNDDCNKLPTVDLVHHVGVLYPLNIL